MTEMSNHKVPVITTAYAIVSSKEDDYSDAIRSSGSAPTEEDWSSASAVTATVEFDRPMPERYTVRPEYAHIPETRGLVWFDDFFENDDDVVAVFDLDYAKMETYYTQLSWACYGVLIFVPSVLGLSLLGLVPCFINNNVRWNIRSRHVAITRDGIRYVQDRRPTCWGLSCTDAGKRSRTIPFDKITDCDIVEAAGNTCICIENTLDVLHVDTASRKTDEPHELTIAGLTNATAFKKLVWAMKREYHPAVARMPPASVEMMDRIGAGLLKEDNHHMPQEDIATLLREIRDELRRNNNPTHAKDDSKADS